MNKKVASLKRKEKDINGLRISKKKVQGGENQSTYVVDFNGPSDTPYELGKWKINIYLPEEYPIKSPSVGFLTPIFHPNIDLASGTVCLDVINQTWTPMYDLVHIFDIFLPQLLTYPNPASPLNQQAAEIYDSDKEKYDQKVKDYIKKYALNQELVNQRKKSKEIQELKEKKFKQEQQKKEMIPENQEEREMLEDGSSLSDFESIGENDDLKMF